MGAGTLIAQGGQNMAQGFDSYFALKRQDALATGQIEAYLKAGAGQGGQGGTAGASTGPGGTASGQPLPAANQKLIDKFTTGKANLTDKMALLGSLTTQRDIRAQDQQSQANQQAAQMNAIKIQQAQRQQQAMGNLMQMGQANAGVGGGVLSPQTIQGYGNAMGQPGQPQTQSQGMTSMMANYAYNTGSAPPPELLDRYMTMMAGVKKPIGVTYSGTNVDPSTQRPTNDIYNRVYQKGDGSMEVDDSPISIPFKSAPPGKVLNNQTFQPQPQGWQPPSWQSPQNAQFSLPPANVAAMTDASAERGNLQQQFAQLQNLAGTAQAYISANPKGDRTNGIMGTETGLKLRQLIWKDGTGGQMEGAAGAVQASILNSVKQGRVTQKEFDAYSGMVPKPTDSNTTILNKVAFMPVMNRWLSARNDAYSANLQTRMEPGQALTKAQADAPPIAMPDFSRPFASFQAGKGPGSSIAAAGKTMAQQTQAPNASAGGNAAVQWAKQNPKDPRAARILQLNGIQPQPAPQ